MELPIKGIRGLSLIDYPGKLAAVIFLGGCNFRCPYCHNKDLALYSQEIETMDNNLIIQELIRRKKILEGVVFTGGEPTLYSDILVFMRKVKDLGYEVKLDTNGYQPELLEKILQEEVVDFVSMDIKAALEKEKYKKASGVSIEIEKILKSIDILLKSSIPVEFRTTWVYPLVCAEDILEIGKMLKGASYALQKPNLDTHDSWSAPTEEELEKTAALLNQMGVSAFWR